MKRHEGIVVNGPDGRSLKVYWMDNGQIRIAIPAKIAISSLYPGKPTKPLAKIIIHQI